jgi:hypothetical protein
VPIDDSAMMIMTLGKKYPPPLHLASYFFSSFNNLTFFRTIGNVSGVCDKYGNNADIHDNKDDNTRGSCKNKTYILIKFYM